MAFTQSEYQISFTVRDEGGSVSVVTLPIDRTTDRTAAANYAAALLPKLQAVSDGAIDKYTITEVYNDATATPVANSDVEQKGVFSFGFTSGNKGVLSVPAVKPVTLATNLKDINLTQAAVAAWVAALKDGLVVLNTTGVGVSVQMVNNYAFPIARVVAAYKQNRLSHKERGTRKG
jgi:hypothetical protein